jgi:hypothetical protein
MRIFFHLTNGHDSILDEEGLEVTELASAQREVLRTIDEIRQTDASQAHEWNGWMLSVVSDAGAMILSLDLHELNSGHLNGIFETPAGGPMH